MGGGGVRVRAGHRGITVNTREGPVGLKTVYLVSPASYPTAVTTSFRPSAQDLLQASCAPGQHQRTATFVVPLGVTTSRR